ncbi:PepSY domain-containing protein [Dyadobacter chenwenxiniae]|uniref:PepSY domain-containing protein n=1 Tax=Dyadobacter chenwenxiniae TaxID=2906456 RepID=A0A9X1TKX4_9BACT|nr:PepSY-associated TM helix domain-containing protein [Dyadobacter chenwenxiniae]MCF0061648.1 PepSY domain-containing protein [Dyadobacter chenwenxiniae]UON81469.1 PepSY domain-containing protein [Dyadobacter chenwenxiniae]
MKKALKKLASQLHLWLGISSGLVVFIVALTGSLLVFEDELEPVIDSKFHIAAIHEGKPRLPLDLLTAKVSDAFPNKKLLRVTIEREADRNVIFGLKNGKKEKDILSVAVDPYSGQIASYRIEQDAFFSVVLRLHRYLCLEETGKAITGISCVMFLIIMITGLVMWWPNRKNRKQRFTIKWNAKFKRLNWDLHAILGFYALPFVFVIAITGLVWSYKWVNNIIFMTFDGIPQQKREAPANIQPIDNHKDIFFQKIYTQTNQQLPNPGKIVITLADSDSLSVTVSKADDHAAINNIVNFLYFDKNNGQLIKKRLYAEETKGMKVRRLIYPIHTGSLLGWPTKILAFLTALIAASLPVTGVIIWLGKKKKGNKVARAGAVDSRNVRRKSVVTN